MSEITSSTSSKVNIKLKYQLNDTNFYAFFEDMKNHLSTFGIPGKEIMDNKVYEVPPLPIRKATITEQVQADDGTISLIPRPWSTGDTNRLANQIDDMNKKAAAIETSRARLWSWLNSNITDESWCKIQMAPTINDLRTRMDTFGLFQLAKAVHMQLANQSISSLRNRIASLKQIRGGTTIPLAQLKIEFDTISDTIDQIVIGDGGAAISDLEKIRQLINCLDKVRYKEVISPHIIADEFPTYTAFVDKLKNLDAYTAEHAITEEINQALSVTISSNRSHGERNKKANNNKKASNRDNNKRKRVGDSAPVCYNCG